MSVKALTNGDSYNILSDEKDGDIQLAVTFLNEDCQLTVLPFKSGDDTQVVSVARTQETSLDYIPRSGP